MVSLRFITINGTGIQKLHSEKVKRMAATGNYLVGELTALAILTAIVGSGHLVMADEVHIDVKASVVVRTMRGGIGASWHAIEEPIPCSNGRSHGGSAWGANSPVC